MLIHPSVAYPKTCDSMREENSKEDDRIENEASLRPRKRCISLIRSENLQSKRFLLKARRKKRPAITGYAPFDIFKIGSQVEHVSERAELEARCSDLEEATCPIDRGLMILCRRIGWSNITQI